MSLSGDIISDMQLDASIEAIGEIAGSINLDGSGSTPTITASATVSPDPGIPACEVVKTGTDEYPNFTFNFSGLKGEQGSQGIPGQDGENGSDGITPVISASASASNTTGVPAVTVTKTGTDAAPNFDFYFENLKGERGVAGPTGETGPQGPSGNDGVTPNITATGSVTNTTGVPSVTITKTGTDLAPTFDFAFTNIKGEQGVQGEAGRNGADGADGADGVTPIISATASVDDAVGIPNVVITRSGTDAAPNYDFAFHNLKGTQGNPGQGVPSGGTTGQVLAKQSSADYDADWETLVVPSTAAEISFDNTGTGMSATDVQDAVTELKSNLTELGTPLTASWLAKTFSSQDLTASNSITLTTGKYIINTRNPLCSNEAGYFAVKDSNNNVIDKSYTKSTTYGINSFILDVSETISIYIILASGGSAITTSYVERAEFRAVKIG